MFKAGEKGYSDPSSLTLEGIDKEAYEVLIAANAYYVRHLLDEAIQKVGCKDGFGWLRHLVDRIEYERNQDQ